MKHMTLASLIAALGVVAAREATAELTLAPAFGPNMVLQRGRPLPVWGQAAAGEKVTVQFAGQKKLAVADAAGNWQVVLDSLSASVEPRTLQAGDRQLTNVLVGEVWLAAGQSNMEFPLAREEFVQTELPVATNSWVRLLNFSFAGQYFYSKPFGSNELARQTPEKFYAGAWQPCSPESAKSFSAVAYYFGSEVSRKASVPVGLIHCAVGGSPAEAWIRRGALESDSELRAMTRGNWLTNTALDGWCRQRGRENLDPALKAGADVPGDDLGPNHPFKPAFLWDAGPARLAPFALRGVLWYQGESNSLEDYRVRQHEKLFPLLVRDWRAAWGDHFPFLFCQLSSIRTNKYKSAFWPEFRDQQRRFLDAIPNTGMAVTSDLGALDDVHPRNKRDVGHRLALWALAKTCGDTNEFSGPLPERGWLEGRNLVVRLSHAAGLKTSDSQPPRGFEIAGPDGVFHTAGVELGKGKAILSATEVSQPIAARYNWQPFATGNVVNGCGLPASTFQMTVGSK